VINSIFVFILALILLQACHQDVIQIPTCENCGFNCLGMNEPGVITNNCINNWECDFKVVPQSKVHLGKHQGLARGNKNVFQMINSTEGDARVVDDEITNILVFELNESQNSFSVEDGELRMMQVHFMRSCNCADVDFKSVSSGCIQGERQANGTWLIQGNLIVPYSFRSFEVKFDAQFDN